MNRVHQASLSRSISPSEGKNHREQFRSRLGTPSNSTPNLRDTRQECSATRASKYSSDNIHRRTAPHNMRRRQPERILDGSREAHGPLEFLIGDHTATRRGTESTFALMLHHEAKDTDRANLPNQIGAVGLSDDPTLLNGAVDLPNAPLSTFKSAMTSPVDITSAKMFSPSILGIANQSLGFSRSGFSYGYVTHLVDTTCHFTTIRPDHSANSSTEYHYKIYLGEVVSQDAKKNAEYTDLRPDQTKEPLGKPGGSAFAAGKEGQTPSRSERLGTTWNGTQLERDRCTTSFMTYKYSPDEANIAVGQNPPSKAHGNTLYDTDDKDTTKLDSNGLSDAHLKTHARSAIHVQPGDDSTPRDQSGSEGQNFSGTDTASSFSQSNLSSKSDSSEQGTYAKWSAQINEAISRMKTSIHGGISKTVLELDDETLGRIRLKVMTSNSRVKIQLDAGHELTKRQLIESRMRLESALLDHNLVLEEWSISGKQRETNNSGVLHEANHQFSTPRVHLQNNSSAAFDAGMSNYSPLSIHA